MNSNNLITLSFEINGLRHRLSVLRVLRYCIVTGIASSWLPPRKRSRHRPKDTWRRMAEKERNGFSWRSWAEIRLAKSRPEWKSFVDALSDTGWEENL